MKRVLFLSALIAFAATASAQQARPNPEIFNQLRNAETGKQLEISEEVQGTLQQIILQSITEFCKSPEGQKPGKCGRTQSSSDDSKELASDRRE